MRAASALTLAVSMLLGMGCANPGILGDAQRAVFQTDQLCDGCPWQTGYVVGASYEVGWKSARGQSCGMDALGYVRGAPVRQLGTSRNADCSGSVTFDVLTAGAFTAGVDGGGISDRTGLIAVSAQRLSFAVSPSDSYLASWARIDAEQAAIPVGGLAAIRVIVFAGDAVIIANDAMWTLDGDSVALTTPIPVPTRAPSTRIEVSGAQLGLTTARVTVAGLNGALEIDVRALGDLRGTAWCPLLEEHTCNGSDDDCDGIVDEAADCGPGSCVRAVCMLDGCRLPTAHCGGTSTCDTNLDSDANCGACGHACDASSRCLGYACVPR